MQDALACLRSSNGIRRVSSRDRESSAWRREMEGGADAKHVHATYTMYVFVLGTVYCVLRARRPVPATNQAGKQAGKQASKLG